MNRVLFYDGTYVFCHRVVQLSVRHLLPDAEVYFAPLQGETAIKYRRELASFPTNNDAIIFVENGVVFVGPKAFYKLSKFFKRPGSFIRILNLLPDFLSNIAYRIIAENRYHFFGKKENCLIPDTNSKNKFLK